MSYLNLDDHLAHDIDDISFLIDKRYKSTHPYAEGVKRSYILRNKDAIKDTLKILQNNYQFEMNVNIDNKIIYFEEDQTELTKDIIERRKNEHSHYKITDFDDFILILTYYNHDKIIEHLTPDKNSRSLLIIILILLLLIAGGVYYFMNVEGKILNKLESITEN